MRYLSIFALLVSASSLASANVITIACGPQVSSINFSVITTTSSVSCAAQNFGGGSTITNVSLGFAGAFSDGNPNNLSTVSFSGSSTLGNFGPITTGTDGLSSNTGFVQNLNPTVNATPGFAAFNVDITTTSIGASVPDSAQYSVFATYTYEVQGDGVPEPSTLALVGGVLVLAGIRKFRS